jgi:hypothetical protein
MGERKDLRRRAEITPVKDPHIRVYGHNRRLVCGRYTHIYIAVTPERTLTPVSVGVAVICYIRSFLEFWTPEVPLLKSPGDQKRARQKKKLGLSRRKLVMLGTQVPSS